MVAGIFAAGTTPASAALSIDQFYPTPPPTPGNVGVALSGGGSRALTASMGQLRALNHLVVNGLPLFAQVKALSTVSGGSWLGVPFVYLPPGSASDVAYLGPWVADQGALTPEQLEQLPAGNAGVPIASPLFAPEGLALQAVLLHQVLRVPSDMLWQTLVGVNILAEHALYAPTPRLVPTGTFSFDTTTVATQVTGPTLNPALAATPINLYADARDPGRTRRPFLICNSAMFINEPGTDVDLLAPLQSTPFIAGILGTPAGTDANGRQPGGGGVTTFGLNSTFANSSGTTATVAQTRQWSLTDAVGTSSAFYAEVLQNLLARWRQRPAEFAAALARHADRLNYRIAKKMPIEARASSAELLRPIADPRQAAGPATNGLLLQATLADLQSLIPRYPCWPVRDPAPTETPQPNLLADGGNLDNSGVAALLAYADIDSIIAFVNTSQPLTQSAYGIADGAGGFIPGTDVIVDGCIPPLFGYQPYGDGRLGANQGYVPYGEGLPTRSPIYAHNQVFPAASFPALLQGLWAASGNDGTSAPAIFTQRLAVVPNAWFGVSGAREVTVVWFHLGFVDSWRALFAANPAVLAIIAAERANSNFPNYSTLDTHLSATQINLLADLTAWSVESAGQTFAALFEPAG
jgi:hypothetical protein